MVKRTVSTYVRLTHEERAGWDLEKPYKVCYISVRTIGDQSTFRAAEEVDEEDPTIDEEDLQYMDEVEENAPRQEIVETLFLLGNHENGLLDWFHSSEVRFIS